MILFNAFIGICVIFISPQVFLYYKYKELKYSLILSFGIIISFTFSWIIFLIFYYFKIESIYLQNQGSENQGSGHNPLLLEKLSY